MLPGVHLLCIIVLTQSSAHSQAGFRKSIYQDSPYTSHFKSWDVFLELHYTHCSTKSRWGPRIYRCIRECFSDYSPTSSGVYISQRRTATYITNVTKLATKSDGCDWSGHQQSMLPLMTLKQLMLSLSDSTLLPLLCYCWCSTHVIKPQL